MMSPQNFGRAQSLIIENQFLHFKSIFQFCNYPYNLFDYTVDTVFPGNVYPEFGASITGAEYRQETPTLQ